MLSKIIVKSLTENEMQLVVGGIIDESIPAAAAAASASVAAPTVVASPPTVIAPECNCNCNCEQDSGLKSFEDFFGPIRCDQAGGLLNCFGEDEDGKEIWRHAKI